jgi:hypothetical protein
MQSRVYIKLNKIARMRLAGVKDGRICELLNLSRGGFSRIVALPEYIELEECMLQGFTSGMDEALSRNKEELTKVMAVAVPAAVRTIMEVAMQRKELKTALAAASEILDRDPDHTFSKEGNVGKPQGAAAGYVIPAPPTSILESLSGNASKVVAGIANHAKKDIVQ